jgi:hypothetical protein
MDADTSGSSEVTGCRGGSASQRDVAEEGSALLTPVRWYSFQLLESSGKIRDGFQIERREGYDWGISLERIILGASKPVKGDVV